MTDPKKPDNSQKNDENRDSSGDKNGNNNRNPNLMSRNIVVWVLLLGLAVALLLLVQSSSGGGQEKTWQEFVSFAEQEQFKGAVVVEDSKIRGELKESAYKDSENPNPRVFTKISPATKAVRTYQLGQMGQDVKEAPSSGLFLHVLISWGPLILIAVLIYFFFFRALRSAGGGPGMLGNFGRSRHRVLNKEHSTVTLDDVAGVDEAKDEVGEIIQFLKNPKKFQRLGGRVPRGVLLVGQPGCGKTLLAKAVAGEAEVPFFSISGSDFVEMFVGVGASRVRDLFKQAKDSSPCIIFLDEIDAVGRRRGSGFASGGHDEREQTLNAILVEMDGFDTSDQVIVMAATNRSDVLDPALTRPGRFDRQINVPLPDIRGRMEVLKVHSRKIKMGPDVDLEKIARGTPLFSGADLAAIINEAAINATLQNKDFVEHEDMEEARDKVRWGRALKSRRIEEDEKKIIAYHEAGHAVVMYYDEHSEPLHKVTIIPRGDALGVTFMLPERDRHIFSRNQLLAQLRVTFGGRIAEHMFCGDISSGAAQDIRQASAIARAMVTQYGMSEKMGFLLYGSDGQRQPWEQAEPSYSDETARLLDEEIKLTIDHAYQETSELLESHRDQLEALAKALLKYETLTREEVERIMEGEPLSKPTVLDLLEQEKTRDTDDQKGRSKSSEPAYGDDEAPGAMPSPA